MFIAIHCDLRQLLASTFLLRTTNIRNRLRLSMVLFSFSGISGSFNVDVETRRASTRLGFMKNIKFYAFASYDEYNR